MQGNTTKRRALPRNVMVAGSVSRSKMRMDEPKAGMKVFNGSKEIHKNTSNASEEGIRGHRRLRRNQSDTVALERRKRTNFGAAYKEEDAQLQKSHSDLSSSQKHSIERSLELRKREPGLLICDGTGVVGEDEEEEEMEEKVKSFVDKEMDKKEEKPKSVEEEEIPVTSEDEEKHQNHEGLSSTNVVEKQQILVMDQPIFSHYNVEEEEEEMFETKAVEKQQNLVMDQRAVNPDPEVVLLPHFEDDAHMFESTSIKHSTMQNIENLVMWRDVSRSVLVFGFGTFVLLSSSYADDINFSIISVSSYAGLVYLAIAFLSKSFRGEKMHYDEMVEGHRMVEEEDAIWLLKMLLPYINELLLKLKMLFSGDPATTLKLAGLLFVMARCGRAITMWSLVKLMFFGVFTIPRICSSYSTQLAKLGVFWLNRVRDGWEACTRKKAVAAAIFALIWNISSTPARIWIFFMVVVAMKFYQQCVAEKHHEAEHAADPVEAEMMT